MKARFLALLLAAVISANGCAVAALTAAGAYAASSIGEKNVRQHEAYDSYRKDMEEVNLKRKEAKLEPLKIDTFEEWKNR